MTMTNEEGSAVRLLRTAGAATDLVARLATRVALLARDARRDAASVARDSEELWTLLSGRGAQLWGAVRATPRLARIMAEGLRVAAALRFHRAIAEAGVDSPHDHVREAARRVREMCVELRGGVLKIGQLASARIDLLPAAAIEELALLQDRVPPVEDASIRALVEAELGSPLDEIFATFGGPIAAASLAQVHEAVLLDGTEVAVKVLVPGIEATVEADLHALRVFGGAIAGMLPGIDVHTTIAELSRAVRAELDCRAEAAELGGFGARFAGRADVLVPAVVHELTTTRVLVMQRLRGARLAEFLEGASDGERDLVVRTLIDVFGEQLLEHGIFHADPHPGNFLVVDGRLALLDFGCVMHLTDDVRQAYAALVLSVLARDAERTAQLFGQLGFAGDPATLREIAETILEAFAATADLAKIDVAAQLTRALRILEAHPVVRIPDHFVLVARVLATLSGVVLAYPPKGGLFPLLGPRLARARAGP